MISRRSLLVFLASIPLIGFTFKRELHPVILKDINETFGSVDNFVKYMKNVPRRKVDKCCNADFSVNANRVMVQTFASFCRQYKNRANGGIIVTSVYDGNGNQTFRWNESPTFGFHCEVTSA